MNNEAMVRDTVREETQDSWAKEYNQLGADLRENNQLLDSLKKLEEDFAWTSFCRILIDPTKESVKKRLDSLVKGLRENPQNSGEIIYNNAFLDVLKLLTDFASLRKKYASEGKRLQGRMKEMERNRK